MEKRYGEILIYQTEDGLTNINVKMQDETVWLTQQQLVDLYQSRKANVSEHIKHIFEEGELDEESVVRKFRTTASDGKNYNVTYYNLDMIISLGYRIKSSIATKFRSWVTERLKEYMIKHEFFLIEGVWQMKKGKLVLANYDARIFNISIKPKNKATKVIFTSKMYDAASDENKTVKIVFSKVAAIDFRINYFDNMIGCEVCGLYQIEEKSFIERLVREIFERRKEIYLLEGDYDYDEDEPNDMLNVLDLDGSFMQDIDSYSAYVQNVDAGVYIVVAKDIQVIG